MIDLRIMMGHRFWRTAARIAWRDLGASRGQAAFILAAMAVSIAGVGGVHSAARVARASLQRDARAWLGGDAAVDTGEPIGDEQVAALDRRRASGVDYTLVTWVLSMAASDQSPDAGFITVKAIDPAVHPFHGSIALQPPGTLQQSLSPETVVVSEATLERLHVRRGDEIRIGGKPFRIAASYRTEPERTMGILSFGMSCILSHEGFARAGIVRGGNAPRNRVLLRLPAGADLAEARRWLQQLVPEGKVTDYRDANRQEISRFEAAATFLSITAFLALVLGTGGVAIAVRQHVEQGMTKLAIMKVTGAQSWQIAVIFAMQIVWLMAGALAIGVPLGIATRAPLLWMARKYAVLDAAPLVDFRAIVESAAVAAFALCPVLAQPFAVVRRTRPMQLLRAAADGATGVRAPLVSAASCLVLAATAFWMLGSWRTALTMTAALAAALGMAVVATSAILVGIRALIHWRPQAIPATLRQGLANLYRPGNRMQVILVSLAMGFMMMLATFQSAGVVVKAIAKTVPYAGFDLLVAGFENEHRGRVERALRDNPAVRSVRMTTQTRMRLTKVNGIPVESIDGAKGGTWHVVYCSGDSTHAGATISDDVARRLGIQTGARLEFSTRSGTADVVVRSTRALTPSERFWFTIEVDCSRIAGLPLVHQAMVNVKPGESAAVRAALNAQFPSLAVIAPEEIAETIGDVTANAVFLVRFVAWYAIGAGLCVLIAIVSASRTARLNEMAILSALGASRRKLLQVYTVEFCAIGLLSGVLGSIAACGASALVLGEIFGRYEFQADWRSAAVTVLVAAAGTAVAGWLPSYRLLRRKPLEILRGD